MAENQTHSKALKNLLIICKYLKNRIKKKQPRKSGYTVFSIISICGIFRRSRADNSLVHGPIWPKFELILDGMHVLITCKFKMDQMNSNREKVETSIFRSSRAANHVVSSQI